MSQAGVDLKTECIVYPSLFHKTLICGCPREYLVLVGVASATSAFLANMMTVLFGVGAVLYINGVIQAKKDPFFFEIWLNNLVYIGKTKNKGGGNVYFP